MTPLESFFAAYLFLGFLVATAIAPRQIVGMLIIALRLVFWPVSAVIWFADHYAAFVHGEGCRRG